MIRRLLTAVAAVLALLVGGALIAGIVLYRDYRADVPQHFANAVEQFKYGSTGGDRLAGIPIGLFKALPELCRDYLPGEGWESLGFIVEPGHDRPVGTSLRRTLGFDRVSLNCATCHVGTYRVARDQPAIVVPGMPANRLDLGAFAHLLENCALDERFNPWQLIQAAERSGFHYGWFDRLLLEYVAVPAMREALIFARFRLRFLDHEITPGPGRFDTFNPAKALLNWPQEKLPAREMVGIVDFPSLWLQEPRVGMHLHWDGNNDSVEERNRSAGFGTGAVPTLADDPALEETATWLRSPGNVPPPWPFQVDQARAARGAMLYAETCAGCHGASGRDFTGRYVGQVTPIEHVRTDPCRLDNYTETLAVEQDNLYAAYPSQRFSHFRKTHGYANAPLDGIWLRGPYLHNGSVPTLRDLLEPAERRPAMFWRGDDLIDSQRVGFVSAEPEANGRALFRYETRCVADAAQCAGRPNPENEHEENICVPGPWAGNSNRGHEGHAYGTDLPSADKDALVEYLKTF
ncbi:MAG: hypothetical protein RQ966_05010 [Acetobacteraceae bacterium]|nr:hypothetical protein [Acetobacteraceae bacterium]